MRAPPSPGGRRCRRRRTVLPQTTPWGRHALLESTDDTALTALAGQLIEAQSVVGDTSVSWRRFLADLPGDASSLETKLARQAELRSLTRKYAADVDGVLRWAG